MLGLFAVALSACTMIPKYERPAPPVSTSFPGDSAATGAGQKAAANIE